MGQKGKPLNTQVLSVFMHTFVEIFACGILFVFNFRSLGVTITSVVPGDYDGDSQMDVLLTTHAQNHGRDELSVFIFWGHNQTLGELLRLLINKIVRLLIIQSIVRKL